MMKKIVGGGLKFPRERHLDLSTLWFSLYMRIMKIRNEKLSSVVRYPGLNRSFF